MNPMVRSNTMKMTNFPGGARGLPRHLDANPIDCFIQTSGEFILQGLEGLENTPLSMCG